MGMGGGKKRWMIYIYIYNLNIQIILKHILIVFYVFDVSNMHIHQCIK